MIGVDFASNKPVIDAWKEYMDKLNSPEPEDENQKPQFYRERDSKFHNLIFAISQSLKYKFTRLEVEKQHYAPVAHGTWAEQEAVLRTGITRLFKGEFSLPIRITEDEAASKK